MPTEQPPLDSRHDCWANTHIEFPLPTRTGVRRRISLVERNLAFWNPFYHWGRRRYKMNKSSYWYFVYDMLVGSLGREVPEDEIIIKEEQVVHLGLIECVLVIPAIFKIAYYYASNQFTRFISAVFAIPITFIINNITYIALWIASPIVSCFYHRHQQKTTEERQRLIAIVNNMQVIPLKVEEELYLPHSDKTPCYQPQYGLFARDEKPTVHWYDQRQKTLQFLIQQYQQKNKTLFPWNNSRHPANVELPTDLPRWILLPLHKKIWHDMGFAAWPLDAPEPPIWGLYEYRFGIAQANRSDHNDCGNACWGAFELPITRYHAFSPSALFIPNNTQPEGLLDALQQLNAFCIQEHAEIKCQKINQDMQKSVDQMMQEVIAHNPTGEKPMSFRDIMLRLPQIPLPLPLEEHVEAKKEAMIDRHGCTDNLFTFIGNYKNIFNLPWPAGQRSNVYTCPLTGLLLWEPLSSSACGEIPHYFERISLMKEQERCQEDQKHREEEREQRQRENPENVENPENPDIPFLCPCCYGQNPALTLATGIPQFSHARELREEIRGWLKKVKQHLEDMREQGQMPINAAAIRRYTALNLAPPTPKDLDDDRLDLIKEISHFLSYGNDHAFLQEEFTQRISDRLKSIAYHLRDGDVVEASRVSRDISVDGCGESSKRCSMM